MGAFGDRLRREREMRGITLDEIAESTKISRRHLESLEKEDFDSLPGGIFNKGFVRAYARFLGIDEDQAVADYSANTNEAPPPEDQFPLEIHEQPNKKRRSAPRPNFALIGGIAAVVVLAGGYALWARRGHPQENGSSVSAAGPVTGSNPASEQQPKSPPVQSAQQPKAAVQHSVPIQQSVPQSAQQNPAPRMVAAAVVPPANTAPAPAPAVRTRPLPPEKSFFIIIKAKEDAWISVVADGRRVAHGTLRAEKQRFIRAGKQIVVTTGNAGGLEVSYNGKPLGVIGNESEARVLTFTPAGMAN